MTTACINRIGTAVPDHDVHAAFVEFVEQFLPDPRRRRLFRRMVERAQIDHRYSYLEPGAEPGGGDRGGFYARGRFPGTAARMAKFETFGIDLAHRAVEALGLAAEERAAVTHLVVASCTGFTAPGIDQQIMEIVGLDPSVERTMVGFMGCSAAVNALKIAHHVVRSEPGARVLVINLELCTLHLQEAPDIELLLSALLFGDGCAACLVSAEPTGLALIDFRAATIPQTQDLITWKIGDLGFDMRLSGEVPARIAHCLKTETGRSDDAGILRGRDEAAFDLWAVHAGGRTILDAVEEGLGLDERALAWSRGVLRDFGNMSSATLMFVLDRMMRTDGGEADGFGMAFGPGLIAETFRFRRLA